MTFSLSALIKVSDRAPDHQSEANREESVIVAVRQSKRNEGGEETDATSETSYVLLIQTAIQITLCNFVVPTCTVW